MVSGIGRKISLFLLATLILVGCSAEISPALIPVTARPSPTIPNTATPTLPPPTSTVTPTSVPTRQPTSPPTVTPTIPPIPPPPSPPPPTTISLAFVGDVMLARALGDQIQWGNLDYPFAKVAVQLTQADFTVANFEAALGGGGYPAPKAYTFRAPSASAEVLAGAGIDLVSLANNHALDYGYATIEQGMALLDAQGVGMVGVGANEQAARAPFLVTVNGVKLAFLSYVNVPVEWQGFDTENWRALGDHAGVAWAVPELIAEDVAAIRPKTDHTVVLLHAGFEGDPTPSPTQTAAARAAIDAGATLVIGHHAHILQGVEQRGAGIIFYGLGNFAFDFASEVQSSAILQVELSQHAVKAWSFTPVVIAPDGQPRLADSAEAALILQQIPQLENNK